MKSRQISHFPFYLLNLITGTGLERSAGEKMGDGFSCAAVVEQSWKGRFGQVAVCAVERKAQKKAEFKSFNYSDSLESVTVAAALALGWRFLFNCQLIKRLLKGQPPFTIYKYITLKCTDATGDLEPSVVDLRRLNLENPIS